MNATERADSAQKQDLSTFEFMGEKIQFNPLTPKEKAAELVDKFRNYIISFLSDTMKDNLTTNASNEAESPAFLVGAVSGSPSFKEQLINDFIPRVEVMKEKELLHLHWLIDNNAPMDFIQLSQKCYNYFTQRIEEYKEYAESL